MYEVGKSVHAVGKNEYKVWKSVHAVRKSVYEVGRSVHVVRKSVYEVRKSVHAVNIPGVSQSYSIEMFFMYASYFIPVFNSSNCVRNGSWPL